MNLNARRSGHLQAISHLQINTAGGRGHLLMWTVCPWWLHKQRVHSNRSNTGDRVLWFRLVSRAPLLGFEFQLRHLLAVWLWVTCLNFLYLSFPVYKMGGFWGGHRGLWVSWKHPGMLTSVELLLCAWVCAVGPLFERISSVHGSACIYRE